MSNEELLDLQRRLQLQHGIAPPQPDPPAAAVAAGMLNMVAAITDANAETETEYLAEDGLLHCRICGGKRQTIITPPFEGCQPRTVRCWCNCPTEQDKLRQQERQDTIAKNRRICFKDSEDVERWTFETDSRKKPELSDAMQNYAAQFEQHRKDRWGLLLYGDTGGGKSVFSAMIANQVLDQGYKVRFTNFEQIERALFSADNKAEFMRELMRYDLLILDDLGAERQSSYMQGIVYSVIDGRVRAGLPVITSTNLTWDELTKTEDMSYKRIYERLLRHCTPIEVDGINYRRAQAGPLWQRKRQQLGMEGRT